MKQRSKMGKKKRPPMPKGVLKRLLGMLFHDFKFPLLVVIVCVIIVAIASTIASIFMNKFLLFYSFSVLRFISSDKTNKYPSSSFEYE